MVRALRRWDAGSTRCWRSCRRRLPGLADALPVDPGARLRRVAAADRAGRAARGRRAAAIEQLLDVLPRGGWIGWVFRIPFVRTLADRSTAGSRATAIAWAAASTARCAPPDGGGLTTVGRRLVRRVGEIGRVAPRALAGERELAQPRVDRLRLLALERGVRLLHAARRRAAALLDHRLDDLAPGRALQPRARRAPSRASRTRSPRGRRRSPRSAGRAAPPRDAAPRRKRTAARERVPLDRLQRQRSSAPARPRAPGRCRASAAPSSPSAPVRGPRSASPGSALQVHLIGRELVEAPAERVT